MPGHLIHVGVSKAGSTALGEWFDSHPQIAYRRNGIAGSFTAFELAARLASAAEPPLWHVTSQESLTAPRVSDDPVVRPARAPGSAVSLVEARERVCRMVHRLFPGATILIVTRGFRGSRLSGYSQYVKSGGHLTPLELRLEKPERGGGALHYDRIVRVYEEVFGPENVVVLPYELLRDDPAAFVGALSERIGLDPCRAAIPARNPSLSPGALVWQRRLSKLVRAALGPLPERLSAPVWRAYVGAARADWLAQPLDLLERLVPGRRDPGLAVLVPGVPLLRGRASSLASRPFFDRYAADYLNDEPARV